jgi:oxygen-independent coproporphyrinogen-3 oxidase
VVAADALAASGTVVGIYVHIPYCRTLCPYCDFVKRRIPEGSVPEPFIDALCREIAAYEGPDEAGSIFFGGGTPSLLAPASLERVLEALGRRFRLREPEITLEANPDDLSPALADAWKALGVNRVSLGVQSFDDEALRYLGRRHDAERARRACEWVAERFANWSMDLIFGAHPAGSFEATLQAAADFAPPHVSAYGLTYEANTPFGKRSDEAVDEDTYLNLFWLAEERLKGLQRYEISNFARPGYECRHNLVYWHNEEYAGFGPAAYAFIGGVRARNVVALHEYLEQPGAKAEAITLSDEEIRLETVIQHLRLRDGLDRAYYRARFGRDLDDDFGAVLAELAGRGLVADDGNTLRPTRHGFELNNEIGLALVG